MPYKIIPRYRTGAVEDAAPQNPLDTFSRPIFSVARYHSPSDEQADPTEIAGQAATAPLAYLVWTDVGFAA